MKRIILSISIALSLASVRADDYAETYNIFTRGIPVIIEYNPFEAKAVSLDFNLRGDEIAIASGGGRIGEMNYSVTPLSAAGAHAVRRGTTSGTIDISELPAGLYVLTVSDGDTCQSGIFKFQK